MRVLVFVCVCMCTHTHTHTHKLHSQILGSNTKSVHPAYSVLPIGESHRSLCCIQKGRCTSCVPTWKAMICEDTTRTITQVLKEGPKIVFFLIYLFIIYLAVPGLSYSTQHLQSSSGHAGFLVPACKLLVAAHGILVP